MMNRFKLISLIFFAVTINSNLYARIASDSTNDKEKKIENIYDAVNSRLKQGSYNDSVMNYLNQLSKTDSVLKQAISGYNLFGLEHRKRALQWNLTSSIIIFWSVIFLVMCGIIFAGLQFYSSLYSKNKLIDPAQSLVTNLEANMKGIKVSSPVLGVIILMISMLFFYLYLKFVYPITEIF
jgi:hypothetical protein